MDRSNRVLLAMDASNFEYVCIWAAFNRWERDCKEDCALIGPPEDTDQNNLPNVLNFQSFRRILNRVVQEKLEYAKWIAKKYHQAEINLADGMDMVFTEDDRLSNNFRKLSYPEYKAQRGFIKKRFDVFAVKEYIQDVVFRELELESKHGYTFVKVEDCESDDIIAVLMKRFTDYSCRILISSDKDFLQLENVNQYDFFAQPVERKIYSKRKDVGTIEMTRGEYLVWKIVCGDKADNIRHVFDGYGDIKSYKLVKDINTLKTMLKESQEAAQRFKLNKLLIDFNSIPKDIEERIYRVLSEKLDKVEEPKEEFDFGNCIYL